jgi:hypothetical protein
MTTSVFATLYHIQDFLTDSTDSQRAKITSICITLRGFSELIDFFVDGIEKHRRCFGQLFSGQVEVRINYTEALLTEDIYGFAM